MRHAGSPQARQATSTTRTGVMVVVAAAESVSTLAITKTSMDRPWRLTVLRHQRQDVVTEVEEKGGSAEAPPLPRPPPVRRAHYSVTKAPILR